ncbi:hypothetical protein BH20CHL1_BH20CHL1_08840 [soil metagenome]
MSSTFFEWNRYVGAHMTPVDAVNNARSAGQTFEEYAGGYAVNQPSEEITVDELAGGMVGDMRQAAHNLAHVRVVGNPDLSTHESTIFGDIPADAENYYAWLETADEREILEQVTTRETE